jgi:hypothetical protein
MDQNFEKILVYILHFHDKFGLFLGKIKIDCMVVSDTF